MEVDPKQQIEDELRRVLNLKHDQPSLNSGRQSEDSRSSTTLATGDVHSTDVGSSSVVSMPQCTVSDTSPAGAAKKIPTASSSSPSINHFKQVSSVNEASRRRKPRRSKQNSPRVVTQEATGVTGSLDYGNNVSGSQRAVKSENPRIEDSEMATAVSADNISASYAMYAGMHTSGSSVSTVTGANSSSVERTATKTLTNQRGGKTSRGRGSKNHMDVSASTVPGRSTEKPVSDDNVHDVSTSLVVLSEPLSSAANNTTDNVTSEILSAADEKGIELSDAPAAEITENVQQPEKKHEKGKICIH